MVHIEVDFNNRARNGLVIGAVQCATGPVSEGDLVFADSTPDSMSYYAAVKEIEHNKVYLLVDWEMNYDTNS